MGAGTLVRCRLAGREISPVRDNEEAMESTEAEEAIVGQERNASGYRTRGGHCPLRRLRSIWWLLGGIDINLDFLTLLDFRSNMP